MTEIVASSQNSSTTGTAISVSAPSGTTVGDVVICHVHANTNTTIVDNNGGTPFTEDLTDYAPNTSSGHVIAIFKRTIVSGDPTTYNFTSGASGRWSIIAFTVRKPHTSSFYDVAPSTTNTGNLDSPPGSSNAVAPTITTVNVNALHIVAGFIDASTDDFTGWPTGYTVLQSVDNNQGQTVAWKRISSPAATGAQTFTHNGSGTAYIAPSYAIRDNGTDGNFFLAL